MSDPLKQEADRLAPRLVEWRRDLHRHPELSFEERRTAGFVAERLGALGVEMRTEVGVTGVLGLLRASKPTGPAVLLRGDMDALPIQEVAGRDYGSTVDGCMHACGHDGHTAMLLGAATLLSARRESLTRDVVFCFQPAEEGFGGAKRMIDDGALEWVEVGSAYALHLWSMSPSGTVEMRPGPMMAAQDEFEARIVGRGGHGAAPHQTIDPIVAAAQAIVALQTIVSRNVDPIESAVLTVGTLHAGTTANIVPADARMIGTLRTFTEPVRELLRTRVREVLEGTASAARCTLDYELRKGYPATVNDPVAVEVARAAAAPVFGEANVIESPPLAASEDFSYFLRERPGAFILVGAGNEERGITAPHHSPAFDIDEDALPRGAELLARLALTQRQPGDR